MPNIKGVDQLSVSEIAGHLGRLQQLAEEGHLHQEDLAGTSFAAFLPCVRALQHRPMSSTQRQRTPLPKSTWTTYEDSHVAYSIAVLDRALLEYTSKCMLICCYDVLGVQTGDPQWHAQVAR